MFRESVRDILECEDYEVVEVSDGKYALEIINDKPFDLLITDIIMPEIEGIELAMRVKRAIPKLGIIGMTGGGRNVTPQQITAMCGPLMFDTILHKPFLAEELLREVKCWINKSAV